jgi:hypothetical protein
MKKQLFLLTLFLSVFAGAKESAEEKKLLTSQDLSDHGQKWAKQVMQKLTKQEVTLLANYLYFNFLATRYDFLIRTSLIVCQNNLTNMQYLMLNREDEAQKCAGIISQQMLFLNEEAMPLKTYAAKAAQACFEHIEDSEFDALKKVIVNLQQYSTSAVNQFISQDWPKSITQLFSGCSEMMKKETEKLATCQNNLEAKVTMEFDDETDYDQYGQQFQQAISAADISYASYLNLLAHTLNVKSMSADIINISAIINNLFYNHLMESMKSNKKIGSCTIMFDENGLIDEDAQDEMLPVIDEKFNARKQHLKK